MKNKLNQPRPACGRSLEIPRANKDEPDRRKADSRVSLRERPGRMIWLRHSYLQKFQKPNPKHPSEKAPIFKAQTPKKSQLEEKCLKNRDFILNNLEVSG